MEARERQNIQGLFGQGGGRGHKKPPETLVADRPQGFPELAAAPATPPPRPGRTPKPEQRRLVQAYLRLTLGPQRRGEPPPGLLTFPAHLHAVRPAFNQLPKLQREIVYRALVDGERQADIALFLDKSPRWVRLQKQAAFDTLCWRVWTTAGVPRTTRIPVRPSSPAHQRARRREAYRRRVEATGRPVHPYGPRADPAP